MVSIMRVSVEELAHTHNRGDLLTSDTSVCLDPSHASRTSSMTPSTCWGSTHRKTRSDDANTSAGVSQTVTTPGNAAARADDLASDRRVTQIDVRDTPAPPARWQACSGVARDVAMAEAIVPQPAGKRSKQVVSEAVESSLRNGSRSKNMLPSLPQEARDLRHHPPPSDGNSPMKPALRVIEALSSPPRDMATLKASAMTNGWRNSR